MTNQFGVDFTVVKTGCGKSLRGWLLGIHQYTAMQQIQMNSKTFHIQPIPTALMNHIINLGSHTQELSPVDMAQLSNLSSYRSLFPYQARGVEFAIARQCRAMICDEMGLGKTRQALTILHYLMQTNATLIAIVVCPASLRVNWLREIHGVIHGSINALILPPTKKKRKTASTQPIEQTNPHPGVTIHIVSYAHLANNTPSTKYDIVICDESHYLKSTKSKRFKSVSRVVKRGGARLIQLSGTPSTKTRDLYAQLKLLDPILFKQFAKFRRGPDTEILYFGDRYCDPKKVFLGHNRSVIQHSGLTRAWELHALLQHFMIRRDKIQVLPNLPSKGRRVTRLIGLDQKQRCYFEREMDGIQEKRERLGSRAAERMLMALMRESNLEKVSHLCHFVKDMFQNTSTLSNQNKYLIFAHHHATLDALAHVMQQLQIPHIQIDGRVTSTMRQSQVDRFQNDASLQVAILGITAAGTGLNLFKANKVVFAELTWNQNDILQAECRAHRLGQTRNVDVSFIILSGSVDEIVWKSINRKTTQSYAVLDDCGGSLLTSKKRRVV
jgi:SWI/SNF-related matrix-associated actin-dependent regulator of chromatin subfamily A-like protein 1